MEDGRQRRRGHRRCRRAQRRGGAPAPPAIPARRDGGRLLRGGRFHRGAQRHRDGGRSRRLSRPHRDAASLHRGAATSPRRPRRARARPRYQGVPRLGLRSTRVSSLSTRTSSASPRIGLWLDSSDQTPDETVDAILARLDDALISPMTDVQHPRPGEGGAGATCREILATLSYVVRHRVGQRGLLSRQRSSRPRSSRRSTGVTSASPSSCTTASTAAEVHLMAVVPEHHRCGIGRQMLRHRRGCSRSRRRRVPPSEDARARAENAGYAKTRAFYLAYAVPAARGVPSPLGPEQSRPADDQDRRPLEPATANVSV